MRRNTHVVSLESAEVTAQIRVENTPSENPRTGLVASSSLLALLRQYVGVRQFL
jgi:predicted dinucleotide-utilizing enzyme